MRVQHSGTDVLPLTWEVPAALAGSWLILAALGLPTGQAVATVLAARVVVWPTGALLDSITGLLTGEPGRGLSQQAAHEVANHALVYVSVASVEILVLLATIWAFLLWWRLSGPGAQYGIASHPQVERVLGPASLRRRRRTIRPDTVSRRSWRPPRRRA